MFFLQKMKELNKPKKPLSSFSLFLSDKKGEINKYNKPRVIFFLRTILGDSIFCDL